MSIPAGSPPVTFIITADRAKAKAFYADVVGLKLMGEDDHAVTFDAGNRTPLRLTEVPGFKAMGHTVLGWHVADIAAAARALVAKGLVTEEELEAQVQELLAARGGKPGGG